MKKTKLLLNDFGGYAFPLQLGHELSEMDYDVIYCYCGSLVTTPQVNGQKNEIPIRQHFDSLPIRLAEPLNKYSLVRRWFQEREYGFRLAKVINDKKPNLVLSANTPLDAMTIIHKATQKIGAKHVFWLQDVLGLAANRILSRKIPLLGSIIGKNYERRERWLLNHADGIVPISDDFLNILRQWKIPDEKSVVIENWAPLGDFPPTKRQNTWSEARGLNDKVVFMYSGTLSMKHNPRILLELAEHIVKMNGFVVVRSQGQGADWLLRTKAERGIENLMVEPFGNYSETSVAFASADVLVALLEREASAFSVPSKVLAYLCASRPLLASIPTDNRAAVIVNDHQAGFAIDPENAPLFLERAKLLLSDPNLRRTMGENARSYAEQNFDIQKIAMKFDDLFVSILSL